MDLDKQSFETLVNVCVGYDVGIAVAGLVVVGLGHVVAGLETAGPGVFALAMLAALAHDEPRPSEVDRGTS